VIEDIDFLQRALAERPAQRKADHKTPEGSVIILVGTPRLNLSKMKERLILLVNNNNNKLIINGKAIPLQPWAG
jgi:hypothetical protein